MPATRELYCKHGVDSRAICPWCGAEDGQYSIVEIAQQLRDNLREIIFAWDTGMIGDHFWIADARKALSRAERHL